MPVETNKKRIAVRPEVASAKPPERKRGIATEERSPGTTVASSTPPNRPAAPAWSRSAPFLPFSPTRGTKALSRSHTRPKTREETAMSSGGKCLPFDSSLIGRGASKAPVVRFTAHSWHANAGDQGRQLLVSTRISERAIERAHFRPGAAPRAERLGRVEGGRSPEFTLIGFYGGDEFGVPLSTTEAKGA